MKIMSLEIETSLSKLKEYKKELLSNFHKFDDFKDDEVRINILNLINNFHETLGFLKSELQFEFELDLSKPIRTKSGKLLEYVTEYDKDDRFLISFKKNFISKQLDIKESHLKRFQKLKTEKYTPKEKESLINKAETTSIDDASVSTNSKIMTTTKKITSKLSQSSQILQSSLVQSQLNMDELTIQNDSLTYLSDKYGYLKTVLEKSDGFINDIKLSSEKDKKRMYYTLIFFGLCVLRVFWRRLFKLPVMFVFNIIFYFMKLTLATMGLISSKRVEVDSIRPETQSSIQQFATVTTDSSTLSDPIFVSSATEISDGTGVVQSETLDTEDSEFDEALSRIIDEL